jgi:hypothetical protein
VVAGNVLFVPCEKELIAFELQPHPAPPRVLWKQAKLNPATGSPVVLGDRVYALRGSILAAADTRTGAVKGELRLKGAYSSSIVAAGGVLYCFNEAGEAQVVQPGEAESKLLASCALKETILCTPAVANGALYVRSDKHLWKIAKG